ncbi:helix-turn-helix transcriptional regulator [Actinosynnema sp. NPDC047251]|uniref:Transcriptional regulator, XRE family n=1 Tax=Saccharothrix espanaensis (strain ATCC 51144 / DSM 44229 / JCM 9112 / NBRC 15066 / NRRL 15764) TaxID=1179773 RepID=K0K768_SACES|nr:helix-turn-helix transcriptional regulator [Saccharothrix espanaensis]CCH32739.1 Transcriptional regulator, XRE family [Saccharothrix espanaensis DSM 44229]
MMEGELGAFLRSRREAVTPAQVGLPTGARRRTPGLRRAELATLAGISVEYLARIEQGRDTRPSAKVLSAIAEALNLGEEDIGFLNSLAAFSNGAELCPRERRTSRVVRREVRAILRQLEPAPCFVVNHLSDLLAWTDGYARLMRPTGVLDQDEPNLLWFVFTDERARAVYPDWSGVADEYVVDLHELRRGDAVVDAFAERLATTVGAEFAARWERRPLGGRPADREMTHPDIGTVRLSFETMQLADPDQRLVVLLPADAATEAKLNRLNVNQVGLRAVGSG